MVASANDELYTPFPRGPSSEEGPASSEEGSDLYVHRAFAPITFGANELFNKVRYRSIDTVSIPHTSSLIASPLKSPQSFSTVHGDNPQVIEPFQLLNHPLSVHRSDIYAQSLTSSAFSLSNSHPRFLSLTDHTLDSQFAAPSTHPPLAQSAASGHPERSHQPTSSMEPQASSSTTSGPSTGAIPSSPHPVRGTRKEISNVVIACRQCRARKIRCDSTRPECNNCLRRNNECVYDAAPKRRGPDKRPGTRQRSCKKRPADGSAPHPKKKRKADTVNEPLASSATGLKPDILQLSVHAPVLDTAVSDQNALHVAHSSSFSVGPESSQSLNVDGYYKRRLSPSFHRSMVSALQVDAVDRTVTPPFELDIHSPEPFSDDRRLAIPPVPSTQFSREVWWDDLLAWYSPTREQSLRDISTDLNLLFSQSSYWLIFINIPLFLRNLYDQEERSRVQPSLVLAGLALATLVRSSELELGAAGRDRALRLRDAAQSALESSWASQWIDLGLAEAAMILALFETSAHPQYSLTRSNSALVFLDNTVATLRLTYLDINDPDPVDFSVAGVPVAHPSNYEAPKKCECINLPQGVPHVASKESWTFVPAWDPSWSPVEIVKEKTRRFVLECTHACCKSHLFLRFLESAAETVGSFSHRLYQWKDTVWALYCRSMLLWNCCVRFQDETLTSDQKTQIAITVFVETRVVEQALDAHICNIDTALIYMCREFISNTRLSVTYLMRRLLLDLDVTARPVWNRRLAEEWLYYQEQVAKRVKSSIHRLAEPSGHLFLRRPFQIGWFTGQVAICLDLWSGDQTLIRALELAKAFLVPIEVLNAMWPCSGMLNSILDLTDTAR
ncbi:hypothetical protein EW146_g2361 [Bondarzewia mesenterica]|uniref:Zn(2)-C6 fungal-type domain-containing protein n=1 Tax=Bondarzewia mesenterica TaxID=1095465 RepID=A0A4V3XFT0_9AGAM|nr:hypothetical protein EW146_g2361 [Bondarzewia mesenterica]